MKTEQRFFAEVGNVGTIADSLNRMLGEGWQITPETLRVGTGGEHVSCLLERSDSPKDKGLPCAPCTKACATGRTVEQYMADAELGRLVRALPDGYGVRRKSICWIAEDTRTALALQADVPETALKGVLPYSALDNCDFKAGDL